MLNFERDSFSIFYNSDIDSEIKILESILTFEDKEKWFKKQFVGNGGYWDGYNRYYKARNKSFDYGLIDFVLEKLPKDIVYRFVDYSKPKIDVSKYIQKDLLRKHQERLIYEFFEKGGHGITKIPTRGGKTYYAAEISRIVLKNFPEYKILFFVDTIDLFEQAIQDFSDWLGVEEKQIGRIKGKKNDIKSINVMTIQTAQSILRKNDSRKKEFVKFLNSVDFLFVDEVHEYASDGRNSIIKMCKNIKFYNGLSATPYKSELEHQLSINSFSRKIIGEATEEELKENGYLTENKIMCLLYEHENALKTSLEYREVKRQYMIESVQRNLYVVDILNMLVEEGYKTLVLSSSKELAYNISEWGGFDVLTGDDDSKKRREVTKKFLKENGGLLIASDIYNKGITLPEVEILFIVSGGKEETLVIQKRGRAMGTTKSKNRCVTIDFMDMNIDFLESHSLIRYELYENILSNEDDLLVVDIKSEYLKKIKTELKWLKEKK